MDAIKNIICPNCGTLNEASYKILYDYLKDNDILYCFDRYSKNSILTNNKMMDCVTCGKRIIENKPFTYRTFGESHWAIIKTDEKVPLYCEDCKTPLELISCVQKKYIVTKCYIYCPLCQYQEELLYEKHRKDFRFAFTGFIPSDLKSKAVSVNQKKEDEVL